VPYGTDPAGKIQPVFFFAQNTSSGERELGAAATHPLLVAAKAINSNTQLSAKPSSCISRRREPRLGRMNLNFPSNSVSRCA
jgi:hypothetical protein